MLLAFVPATVLIVLSGLAYVLVGGVGLTTSTLKNLSLLPTAQGTGTNRADHHREGWSLRRLTSKLVTIYFIVRARPTYSTPTPSRLCLPFQPPLAHVVAGFSRSDETEARQRLAQR